MKRLPTAALIFVGCTLLYYLTRSPALDEWDSVQFAMGVEDFNLWKHQPHPPGYPLYIAFGWLAERLFGLDVHDALSLGSALGGGMFVAGWFVLIARRFPLPVAAISTLTLAGMVNTWMSATKVITDPLGAGFITLALVFFDLPRRRERGEIRFVVGHDGPTRPASRFEAKWLESHVPNFTAHLSRLTTRPWWPLAAGSLAASAAVGVRPQNFGILLFVVALATIARTRRGLVATRQGWQAGLAVFLAGCLLWLVPMLALQARTPESAGDWFAYSDQLIGQWRWRLDQPKAALIATGGQSKNMLLYRLDHHILGWITRGFGFTLKGFGPGWLGLGVLTAGWTMFVLARRPQPESESDARQDRRSFWQTHLPWAAAYFVMIFCFLPGDQRYYLPIFPLFIVAAVSGYWFGSRGAWRWLALTVPAATLLVTLPLVGPNHREEPPPVRLIRWLQARYPHAARSDVWLFLRDTKRHADWYAPDFCVEKAERLGTYPFYTDGPRAIYTDEPSLIQTSPGEVWKDIATGAPLSVEWRKVAHFERSPLIYRKHNMVDLYQMQVTNTGTGEKFIQDAD